VRAYKPFTETLHDAVVILTLPQQTTYGGSTQMVFVAPPSARPGNDNPGERWPQKNQVVWKLGEFASGQSFDAYTHATYRWGLPAHLMTEVSVRLVARNFPDPDVNLDTYWNFVPTAITDQHNLSADQITATLFVDPELLDMYQDALAQGFKFYGTAYTQTLNTGVSSLDLVLIDPQRPGEVVMVRRVNDRRVTLHTTPTTLSAYTRTGGWSRSLETGAWTYWGDWNAGNAPMLTNVAQQPCGPDGQCANPSWGLCFRNCLLGNLPNWLLGKYLSWFGDAQSLQACSDCASYGGVAECRSCAAALAEKAADLEGIGIGLDVLNCADECNDPNQRDKYVCSQDRVECGQFGLYGAMGINVRRRYTCDSRNCTFLWGFEDVPCAMSESCDECCTGKDCDPPPPPPGLKIEIRTAHDPNALYGPNRAAPGEWITYTVEYENLGEGTAYGVYVIDQLPASLDRTSLQINDGGAHLTNPDRIVWPIGTVISHTGGSLSFSARVSADTLSGTVLINRATVYFPSVPETTPTNDIVTLIETVSAQQQQIEARGGVPVTFTLHGSSGSAQPLIYHVIESPRYGVLSGLAPTLTYTPALSFEGLDRLTFTASDGVDESSPAEVIIAVQPGNDPTPPKVIATEPISRAQKVPVYLTPTVIGGPYLPTIWLQFSKPISATTITTQTVYVIDQQGHRLSGLVVYDVAQRAARFAPLEPLRRMQTYTATVTTSVQDAIGHALAASYTWRFETEYFSLYLPLLRK
ncbi:MAG: Ig-like domain-containing protein, partial [Chloroflexi bacterium]|nr:Ig-like domain-containing protein [Chloroflexota bacterium]